MPPVTALLYCYRIPTMNAQQFKAYIEDHHVPLVKSLLGSTYPLSHTRYYTDKSKGFTLGEPTDADADLLAVITFEDEKTMQESMRMRNADGIKEQLRADEDKFMDGSRTKFVLLNGNEDVYVSTR